MDRLEARVRVFECLYNNQFHNFVKVFNKQIDELVYKTIEIAQKLNEGE